MSEDAMTCDEAQPLLRRAQRGHLDGPTHGRVQRHLEGCAACRKVADEERALDRLLETELPRYAAPLALRGRLLARLPAVPARRRRWPALVGVAAAALVAIVALRLSSGPAEPLLAEAVADHLRVIYREHPVDIESGGPHQVKPWFTGRLDFAPPAVFGGDGEFTLTGGSVGYFLDRQAAVLVYKRQLHTITLLVFRADALALPAGSEPLGRVRASVRQRRGFSVVLWRDGELGYALISDLNARDLVRLGERVAGAVQ